MGSSLQEQIMFVCYHFSRFSSFAKYFSPFPFPWRGVEFDQVYLSFLALIIQKFVHILIVKNKYTILTTALKDILSIKEVLKNLSPFLKYFEI